MELTTLAFFGGLILILAYIHITQQSALFGIFMSIVMILGGMFVILDGIEFKSGEIRRLNETASPNYINVTNVYENWKTTDPNYNNGVGLSVLLFGIVALFINSLVIYKFLAKRNDK